MAQDREYDNEDAIILHLNMVGKIVQETQKKVEHVHRKYVSLNLIMVLSISARNNV